MNLEAKASEAEAVVLFEAEAIVNKPIPFPMDRDTLHVMSLIFSSENYLSRTESIAFSSIDIIHRPLSPH